MGKGEQEGTIHEPENNPFSGFTWSLREPGGPERIHPRERRGEKENTEKSREKTTECCDSV